MKKSSSTESQIVATLKEADAGVPVNEIWRYRYNQFRPHSALNCLPPEVWQQHQPEQLYT